MPLGETEAAPILRGEGDGHLVSAREKGRTGWNGGDPSPALFAQGQVAVLHLPRTSSLRYGKEKVNAARPTVHLACEGRIVFLRETAVVAGCIIRSRGRSGARSGTRLLCRECKV
jgi:hypothetical protein